MTTAPHIASLEDRTKLYLDSAESELRRKSLRDTAVYNAEDDESRTAARLKYYMTVAKKLRAEQKAMLSLLRDGEMSVTQSTYEGWDEPRPGVWAKEHITIRKLDGVGSPTYAVNRHGIIHTTPSLHAAMMLADYYS